MLYNYKKIMPSEISINDMDKFEKKRANKEESIYKKRCGMIVTTG